jgi:UDP-galactopyranose mutase
VARTLFDAGVDVHVVEREPVVGGHARGDWLNGVYYEPNGAHIFHTGDASVAEYVQRFGMTRRYEHRVLTEIFLREDDDVPVLLSWPPQIAELKELADWPLIERELAELPDRPAGDDFETWVVSLMGRRLYGWFIEGYTRKQWGCDPSQLSSRLAPKRVELRDDGYTRLFRDAWEFFPLGGPNSIIEEILRPVPVTCGVALTIEDAGQFEPSAVVITAPLDEFVGRTDEIAWRGIHMRSHYIPTAGEADTVTPTYVVNCPSLRVPYTRTIETKHASRQRIKATVVSEEHPGASARHYPVLTPNQRYEQINTMLQSEVSSRLQPVPVYFCGRLATYTYIDQDQAIARGLTCAAEILASIGS